MTWANKKLGSLCRIEIGKTPLRREKKYWKDGLFPFLKISDMGNKKLITNTDEKISEIAVKEQNCRLVPPGTILMSFKLSIGVVGINNMPLFTNEAIAAFYINSEKDLSKDYLFWALQNVNYDLYIDRAAKGKTLNKSKLRNIKIPLPPLDEQKHIATILDQADALRCMREQSLSRLDDLMQSVFLKMFGDPVIISKDWPIHQVKSFCDIVRGSSPRPKGDPRYFGGDVPRLMVSDMTRDGYYVTPKIDSLTEAGAEKSRPMKKGSLVMAVSGNVGLVSILNVDACIHDGIVGFRNLIIDIILPEYLLFVLGLLKRTYESKQDGAIFKNLTTKIVKAIEVPVPPLSEQKRWQSFFQKSLDQKKRFEDSQNKLDELFSSLQQISFSGKL